MINDVSSKSGGAKATHFIINERPPAELRNAQLAIAGNVFEDDRLNDGWEREADLMELLDAFGLYRRI